MSRTVAQEMLVVFFARLIYASQLPDHPEHERLKRMEEMCRKHAYFKDVALKKNIKEMNLAEIIELRLRSKTRYLIILYNKTYSWKEENVRRSGNFE
jgi:hypothetical protein